MGEKLTTLERQSWRPLFPHHTVWRGDFAELALGNQLGMVIGMLQWVVGDHTRSAAAKRAQGLLDSYERQMARLSQAAWERGEFPDSAETFDGVHVTVWDPDVIAEEMGDDPKAYRS